jgi:Family of unknown function (DUF6152)
MRSRFSLLLGGVLLVLSLQAWAHHGWGGQEQTQSTISGTVKTAVSLAGPHATMQVVDGSGQLWDITLAPPPRTARAGLKEDTIPVGAEVTIVGNRNRDKQRFEMKGVRVTYDGKSYDVYPDRIS